MINNVTLIGHLTRDAELKYTGNGSAVATFNLAVNRKFTNANGEREADFINCVIWKKPAETLANYTRKGSKIGIVGRIQTRNYENQQGQRVYVTEVVVENFQLLDARQDNQQGQNNQQSQNNYQTQNNQQSQNNQYRQDSMPGLDSRGFNKPFEGSKSININDDDLPF